MSDTDADETTGTPYVTRRALILGTLLILPNVYWVMMVEGIWHTGHPSVIALPWGVVFNIIVLLLLNVVLKRFCPKYALTQAEFVTVYVMVAIAVMLSGHDTLQLGVPNLSHAWWFANDANNWADIFHDHLPRFATVSNLRVLEPYYSGHESLYTPLRLRTWYGPVLWWSAVVFAVGVVMIGINVLLRKQWTEREKLGFPIVQLPLAMTADGGASGFFTNKVLWIGIIAAALLDIYNGLHEFLPALPIIDVRHDRGHFINTRAWGLPWGAMGRIPLPLYPFLIALGFMIPLDLCFSMWFFYIFRKLQQVAAAAFPVSFMPKLPYAGAQSFGAWFALFGYAMWVGRDYFGELATDLIHGDMAEEAESADPMSHKTAVVAIILGIGFLIFFMVRAGMTMWAIIPFIGFVIVIHTAITRIRAELGPPAHEMAGNMNAANLEVMFAGSRAVGPANLAIFPLFWWLTGRGCRTTPMPVQLEAFKMAEVSRAEPERLMVAMAIAFALGGIGSYWSGIHLTYQHGITPLVGHNWGQWRQMASWINFSRPPNWQGITFLGAGGLFTLGMVWARTRFMWWPLHPAGYALGMLFGVEYFWSCLLIAWLVKWAILHWGGHKVYQRFQPAVFGVIIGEYAVGAFWSAMSVILKRPMYDFSPG